MPGNYTEVPWQLFKLKTNSVENPGAYLTLALLCHFLDTFLYYNFENS